MKGEKHQLDSIKKYLLSNLETIECPVCGCGECRTVYDEKAFRGEVDVRCVICCNCTHLYLNPRPSLEAYEKFYANEDYQKLTQGNTASEIPGKYNDESFWQNRVDHGRRLYKEHCEGLLAKEDIVFDFGAGDGAWLCGLREMTGCAIDGNEPSRQCVAVLKEKAGVEMFSESIERLRERLEKKYPKTVKLAIVSGSLQHILQPMGCLKMAYNILCDDGYLYVCNHDLFQHHIRIVPGQAPRSLKRFMTIDHVNYYHENSYRYMVRKAGFEILRFNIESRVRPRHMEIFARKTISPNLNVKPEHSWEEILQKIATADAGARKYSSLPMKCKRFMQRTMAKLAGK